jgi:peroxiredoxin
MKGRFVLPALAAVLALAFAVNSYAAKFNKVLEIGAPAPAWTDLTGTDDKKHSLSDLQDAKAVVVIFTCNSCPVAVAYEDRFVEFAKEYKDKGVEVVAINPNDTEGEKLPQMKDRAHDKNFGFAYLADSSQEVARSYGATVTPHVFVLDGDRRIAYMGNFDDNIIQDKVKQEAARAAVDAVLSGKQPEVKETLQSGCGIKYRKK